MRFAAPDAAALLAQARTLSGLTVGAVASEFGIAPPPSAVSGKGWVGELLEAALGADAGNDATPDFRHLGIELKTIPLRPDGQPVESTWVTRVPLEARAASLPYEQSTVGAKLGHVLWVPIEAQGAGWLERRIGHAVLWQPDATELDVLRRDYEDLMGRILTGRIDEVTGRLGDALQIRPKGRDSRERVLALDADGASSWTSTRGFYLRPRFTASVLRRVLGGSPPFAPTDLGATLVP